MKLNFNRIFILICMTLILILSFFMTISYVFFSPNPTFIGSVIMVICNMVFLGIGVTILGFVSGGNI